jgi:hypothetical protein
VIRALLLVDPPRIRSALAQVAASGRFERVPTEGQLARGILRMWRRLLFRSDTIGTSSGPVRRTWRARALRWRAARLPFLVRERAIHPLDLSGLRIGRDGLIAHLLAAHHDRRQAVYDLELLEIWPGALDELVERARAVADGIDPRSEWLKDLVVFEGYHRDLVELAVAVRERRSPLEPGEAEDPDLSFRAYLAWCCRQAPVGESA